MNFKKVIINLDLEGTTETVDISKELGNYIYKNTEDLSELELAKKIYFSEDADYDNEEKIKIKNYLKGFKAFVQIAIIKLLDE